MGLRPEHAPRQRDPPSLPSWSSVSARLCSCPVTSGVLGHPELQKLKLKSNLCRSCLAPLTRQNVSARASVARQQWLELREEPPCQTLGRVDPEEGPPCTGVLWPSRLGRGRCKQSCSGCPGDAFRGADSDSPVPRGPSRGLGPWIPTEWPWSPTGRRCTVLPEDNWRQAATGPSLGWGTRSCAPAHATQLACHSPVAASPNPAPAFRPLGALGSRPGTDPAAEGARGCEGPGRVPPSLSPVRLGSAERNGAGRSAARAVPSLSERPPWRRGAVTQA